EQMPSREDVPAAEQDKRAEDGKRRVVEDKPVEVRFERNTALVGRKQEYDADEADPEDRDPIDQLVVLAEVPRTALERLACAEPQDDRQNECDVQPDHGNGG